MLPRDRETARRASNMHSRIHPTQASQNLKGLVAFRRKKFERTDRMQLRDDFNEPQDWFEPGTIMVLGIMGVLLLTALAYWFF